MNDTNARVRYEKRGRVAYIILDRPHVLNAMDVRMHEELLQIWDDFEKDSALWVGVLTGAGDRSFSVGQDLKELVARTGAGIPPTTFGSRGGPGWPRLTERFNLSKPVVARVNGYAFGGGFELALACDIIVAAEQACFALPEAKLGLIPGAGGLFRLTRQIPFKIAMGYLMTGRRMTATRAYELGLVNEVVPISELDASVTLGRRHPQLRSPVGAGVETDRPCVRPFASGRSLWCPLRGGGTPARERRLPGRPAGFRPKARSKVDGSVIEQTGACPSQSDGFRQRPDVLCRPSNTGYAFRHGAGVIFLLPDGALLLVTAIASCQRAVRQSE